MSQADYHIWKIFDDRAGHNTQLEVLSDWMMQDKRFSIKTIHNMMDLSPQILKHNHENLSAKGHLILSVGGSASLQALALRDYIHRMQGKTVLIQVLSPKKRSKDFDLILLPKHDRKEGGNILTITGALTPDIAPTMGMADGKKHGLLIIIGGDNKHYKLDDKAIAPLLHWLQGEGKNKKIRLTTSRRTPKPIDLAIKAAMQGNDHEFYSPHHANQHETVENPYKQWLAEAETLLVTQESISMICEAIRTKNPVALYPLSKRLFSWHHHKFEAFAKDLIHQKLVSMATIQPELQCHFYTQDETNHQAFLGEKQMILDRIFKLYASQ